MGRHRTKHRAPRGPMRVLARSWYAVLDIEPTATPAEIEAAYRLALDGAPSAETDDNERESIRRDVETAFRVLSDPKQRARFDEELARGGQTPAPGDAGASGRRTRRGAAKSPVQNCTTDAAGVASDAQVAPKTNLSVSVTPRVALRFLPPLPEGESPSVPQEPVAAISSIGAIPPPNALAEGLEREGQVSDLPRHLSILPQEVTPLALPSIDEIDGQVVRRLREERGLSLEVLASHTHIGKAYLQAIEENAVDELPARVYLRGFLTQVARVLRVDRRLLADGYLRFVERRLSSPGP